MAQNQQHGDQSIGGSGTQDGIQGTPSGTEGATSGQGVEKGQSKQSAQKTGQNAGKDGGNRQSSTGTETYQRNDLFEDDREDTGVEKTPRSNHPN
ncbi:hypothetical protein GJ700_10395 [Duganella sp. FT92W]|uniref:Uncharacterized protein n=1 Tax=Pseudoduganella rivuli TaxID=2666085 RepID=A0A7X2LSN5_9BURK|nr:hypothetical protein [Pseudoduganella rivuli]MRV72123.1 hypothetical protein [Pseudoduganella rivuli]